jgi:universal stress protein E
MQIVAATDFSTRANRAIRQAGFLAQARDAKIVLLHVVDDDQPGQMIDLERREAERMLAEQMNAVPELRGVRCGAMVATGDPFDGIVREAAGLDADLIVMGAHRRQLLRDIFIGTTLERVIRTGSLPVLMVNNEAQRHYANVLAPVDMSKPSAQALRVAREVGLISDGSATLVHAFVAPGQGKMRIAGLEQASIDEYVAGERQRARQELEQFLAANNLGPAPWSFHLGEGPPMEVISRAIEDLHPDLLVMGTHGHSGLVRALIGSVTEEALRTLNVDILAVPPARS